MHCFMKPTYTHTHNRKEQKDIRDNGHARKPVLELELKGTVRTGVRLQFGTIWNGSSGRFHQFNLQSWNYELPHLFMIKFPEATSRMAHKNLPNDLKAVADLLLAIRHLFGVCLTWLGAPVYARDHEEGGQEDQTSDSSPLSESTLVSNRDATVVIDTTSSTSVCAHAKTSSKLQFLHLHSITSIIQMVQTVLVPCSFQTRPVYQRSSAKHKLFKSSPGNTVMAAIY